MAHKISVGLWLAVILAFGFGVASAQAPAYHSMDTNLSAAPSGARLERVLLLLEPSQAQRQALIAELKNQRNSSSLEYHHWLTPAGFADAYSNSATEVAEVSDWLSSQGLQVASIPASRGWIEFSGTVAQVEKAFQTRVDLVTTVQGSRAVLANGIIVPTALKPLVHGLVSLDGALPASALTTPRPMSTAVSALALETSPSRAEALTPQLVAQMLHLDALHAAGQKGTGETIAIAARSNVNSADVAAFRSAFGLSASPLVVHLNGTDPGMISGDQAEAELAASWAGVAAPGAQIMVVPAASTTATDGLDLSLAAIVDQSLAHTVTVGYSACEAALSEPHQAFYAALYRQAAAEGIAVIAATGDSGPSACHAAGSDAKVSSGYGVNALASTPWNTSVGVASFDASGASTDISVLSAWSPASATDPAYAGGGGSSTLYGEPSWQPASAQALAAAVSSAKVSAVGSAAVDSTAVDSTSSHRLLPDIALPTAIDTDVNPGLAFCLSASTSTSTSGCTLVRAGGSSASAAIFAGIGALLAEKYGAQGNLAPNLYAQSKTSGVYEDVAQGSARLWCTAGSSGCDSTGQIGFAASTGYDLATGLGAVNAQKLVAQWATPEATGAAVDVTIGISPTESNSTYNPSAQVTLAASVLSLSGGTPTGSVTFVNAASDTALSTSSTVPLGTNGSASWATNLDSIFSTSAPGSYNIEALYTDSTGTYATTHSSPTTITTQKSFTTLAVVPSTTTPVVGATLTVTVTLGVLTSSGPPAGSVAPLGVVTLNLSGGQATSYIAGPTTSNGITTATFSVPVPATLQTLQATYSGDSNYTSSTSLPITMTVAKLTTTTTLAVTGTPTAGSLDTTWTFVATVTPSAATPVLTGSVNFYDGTTLIGTSTVVAGTSSDTATLAVALPNNVSHSITAVYSGDSSWMPSTTTTVLVLAANMLADSVTLTANILTAAAGQSVILTVTVTPSVLSIVEPNPTGNVVFYNGNTIIGTVPLVAVLPGNTSVATLSLSTLPGGWDNIHAYYLGDLYYNAGVSNYLNLDIEAFTITPASTNPPEGLTIVKGSSGSASFIITGYGGFSDQVQVVCAVPTQDDMTCTATPQQVTPTAVVTFVVQTFDTGNTTGANHGNQPLWPRAVGGTALAMLGFFLLPPFRRRARLLAEKSGQNTRRFLILLLLLAGLGGTGIGCSNSSLVSSPGTPLGETQLTITASDYVNNTVVSKSVYLPVNVVAKP